MVQVNLYKHHDAWVIDSSRVTKLKETIKGMLNPHRKEVETVDIYLMKNNGHDYKTGSKKLLNVFVGSVPHQTFSTGDAVLTIGGNTIAVKKLMPNEISDKYEEIKAEDGTLLAYYSEDYRDMYVPYELADLGEFDPSAKVIELAVKTLVDDVIAEIANRDDWVRTKQKDRLEREVKNYLSRDSERNIQTLESRLEEYLRSIEELKANLKTRYDKYQKTTVDLDNARKGDVHGLEAFMKGLDLIAEHPMVSSLKVSGNQIEIHIDKVYAHAHVRGKERRYYIGNMIVKIDISNTQVRFFGDNKRRGFWSQDPHPHVNGREGTACLGNVGATIAELCSQKEIYPLFLVCLDFLQNANTDDGAGRKIVMWDEVDENGKIIRRGGEDEDEEDLEDDEDEAVGSCDRCETEIYDEDEMNTVYTGVDGDGSLNGEETWCNNCREHHTIYHDGYGEAIATELNDRLGEEF